MKNGLILLTVVIVNLYVAFLILSVKSDWAVVGFFMYLLLIIYLTQKSIQKL